jgi:hypothetical protein
MEDCKISPTPMEKALKLSAKTDSKEVSESLYRQLVGNLIYLTATRPNLSFVVSFHFQIYDSVESRALDSSEASAEICERDT